MIDNVTYKKLGDVIKSAPVVRGGNRPFPILSMTMHDGIVLQSDRFKKELASMDKSAYKVVKRGQLVVGFPIDEGVIYIQSVVDEGIMSPAYNVWDVDTSIVDLGYLEICLHSHYAMQYYKSKLHGSTARRRTLTNADLLALTLPFPSLEDQQRIVRELDAIHAVLAAKNEQLRELDKLAEAIFYSMFGDPITNEKGWDVKKIDEVICPKSAVKRASKEFQKADMIRYIDISSIDNKAYTVIGTTDYLFAEAPSRAQQCVQMGDILVSLVRPNLRNIAVVNLDYPNTVASSGFGIVRTTAKVNSLFLKYVILGDGFTLYLERLVTGANYPAVKESDIRNFKTILPPLDLQQAFASKISAIEQQKELIRASIAETEALLAARMQYYFD